MFLRKEFFGLPASFLQIALIRDVVALEHAARPVSGDLHDHGFGHSGPAKIADCRTPQIVEEQIWKTSARTMWIRTNAASTTPVIQ